MEIFNSVVTETKIVLQQGGPVLWAMLVLSLIMYGLIVSTWIGLIRVKREVIAIDDTDVSYQNLKTVEEDIAIFALDRFAWVKRRLPMIAVYDYYSGRIIYRNTWSNTASSAEKSGEGDRRPSRTTSVPP